MWRRNVCCVYTAEIRRKIVWVSLVFSCSSFTFKLIHVPAVPILYMNMILQSEVRSTKNLRQLLILTLIQNYVLKRENNKKKPRCKILTKATRTLAKRKRKTEPKNSDRKKKPKCIHKQQRM